MDNPINHLRVGLVRLGLPALSESQLAALWAYAEALLKWNQKVSLTAITQTGEVVEKHLVDSLSVLPEVGTAQTLLDLGAGAGLPGIPLAVALPGLRATLIDSVAKKVAFMKAGAVAAAVAGRVKAVHLRAGGRPDVEGVPPAEVVVARALTQVDTFLSLAAPYLAAGGRAVAMLGRAPARDALTGPARDAGLQLVALRTFELPFSRAPRAVATFERLADATP